MRKELKDKWVAALRSGEYTQATGSLKVAPGCFCAIGLLYEVADGDWIEYDSTISAKRVYFTKDRTEAVLVDPENNFGLSERQMLKIMKMNDSIENNCSFDEIADYIEKYIEIEE